MLSRIGFSVRDLSFLQGIIAGIAIIIAFILMCQFVLWQMALVIIIFWSPWCYQYSLDLAKKDLSLALYFVFAALQSVHMSEHIAQMIQIHVLGRIAANSHGLFGAAFDVETVHFLFDSVWIPFWTLYLIYKRKDLWMIVMLPLAILHCAEHIVIMDTYLRTGVVGSPGILAQGGLIGSPLSRPDLHFGYNALETLAMLAGFRKAIQDE